MMPKQKWTKTLREVIALNAVLIFLVMFATTAFCQVEPRLVTVTGEGDVTATPNQVSVNFQMETFDPVLSKAKLANDEAIKKVLEIVKKYKISPTDFKTDYFTVRYDERYTMDEATRQQRSKKGYFVTKNVAILLRDVEKFEALYTDALEAGINNIYGVEFRTSELKKFRDQARSMAARIAKEKAQQLAADLGQTIGQPHAIQENIQSNYWGGPRVMSSKMMMADGAPEAANNETIALGQIKISASVTVSFELQ